MKFHYLKNCVSNFGSVIASMQRGKVASTVLLENVKLTMVFIRSVKLEKPKSSVALEKLGFKRNLKA